MTPIANFALQMARRIEIWAIERLVPYAKNARTHSPEQIAQIAASIVEFGFNAPILVSSDAGIIASHGRLLAARKLGLAEVPVVVLDHLSETQRRAYIIADNKLALNAGWDEKLLAQELRDLADGGLDLALVGFSDDELEAICRIPTDENDEIIEEEIPDEPTNPVTRAGDVWTIGRHRLVCGDCRDRNTLGILFVADARASVCMTSPPYATRREYDASSGFKPVPPAEYVAWYADVAAGVESVLAADGSYFLNIKEHADDGERDLYVKSSRTGASGAGASLTSSAGGRPTMASLAAGVIASKTHGNQSSISAASSRLNSGLKRSATSPRTASTTTRAIRNRSPEADCWAPASAALLPKALRPRPATDGMPAWRARRTWSR
jgi:hypothetical protein